jgi:hypothetical protein
MAKVTGPLMSMSASGTLGGTLVFSVWNGRAYVRKHVIPTNPKTAMQTGIRSMWKFLAKFWASISVPNKATWATIAAAQQFSNFNAFMQANMDRWQNFFAPTEANPAAEASTGLTVTTQTCTGSAGHATLSITPSGATSIWGIAIFRDIAEITTPSWANCIAVVDANGANAVTYVDSPLAAATYHYRTAVMNVDGKMGTVHADGTATVT